MKRKSLLTTKVRNTGMVFLLLLTGFFLQTNAQTSREYPDTDVAAFVTDLEAGTYDTLVLTTSGGVYDISYPAVPKTTVIMGKEGLAEKPILKNTSNTSSSSAIIRINGSSTRDTVYFENLEFDGSGAGTDPLIIRCDDNTHIVIKNCSIKNALNTGGAISMRTAGTSIDIQNTLFANGARRIICPYSTGELYGDINIQNCTFSGITQGDVIYFRSASGVYSSGNNVTVDHCTFDNIGGDITRYQADSIHGTVAITNSIFSQVSGVVKADIIDYNYLAGMSSPPTGTNTITTAPVFADASNLNYALVNKDQMVGSDFLTLGDLSWYTDDVPPTVYSELIYTDETHLTIQFNEPIDAVSAVNVANYTLSGTFGLTGNPSEAVLESNGKDVTITVSDLSAMTVGQTLIVTVTNIGDLLGNIIVDNNVATYTLLDNTPPVITITEQAVTNDPGQTIVVQSNELGLIYLVLENVDQSNLEELQAAVENGEAIVVSVNAIDTDLSIPAEGLKAGVYYAYSVDEFENISEKSTNAVTISDITAPVIGMPVQAIDNSGLMVARAVSNETGLIYLILEGEAQSTVDDFEAAVASGKGSSAVSVTPDDSVSLNVKALESGMYYAYAVDHAGNISTMSENAVTISELKLRIRYYESSDTEQLVSDMISAIDGDIFVLTTSGGEYPLDAWVNISAKIAIMAAEDLAERPVLTMYKESNTVQTMRLYADGCGIYAKGIEFDSKSRGEGAWPPKYAIRSNADIGNYSLVLEDCYFRGTWQANDGSAGATIKLYNGTYADSIIIRNCIFEDDEAINLTSKGDFSWEKFEISNCTFMNMPDEAAINIIQRGNRKNLPLLIDHCSFYNAGGIDKEVIITDSLYKAEMTNSIFASTLADTSWHLFGDVDNQTMVDYVNFFECAEPLTQEGGVLGTNKWNYDPMFADPDNGNLSLGNNLLYDLGSDGLPLGDLRWADIFGPKVNPEMIADSDSTLLIRFDEWIDTTTAEIAANYSLSGSAGYSGNVKKAEIFNFKSVLLTLENFADQIDKEIVVTVTNVEDTLGNVVDPGYNTATYIVEVSGPVVIAESQTVSNGAGEIVSAQANQIGGYVWVILDGEPHSSLEELEAAVSAKKGAKTQVTEAFADMGIGVYNVVPGTYYAYATDEGGNVSEKGANAITITDGVAPAVSSEIQSVENGSGDVILAQSSELGTIYIVLSGEPQTTVSDFVAAKTANKASSAIVTVADTDVQISTTGLVTGIYYAYAMDEAGNISARGSNPINITQSTTAVEKMDFSSVNVYSLNRMIIVESGEVELDRAIIIDITGRTVIDERVGTSRSEFFMNKNGIYIVKLIKESDIVGTHKIVVW